jgi:hypothetical protein
MAEVNRIGASGSECQDAYTSHRSPVALRRSRVRLPGYEALIRRLLHIAVCLLAR